MLVLYSILYIKRAVQCLALSLHSKSSGFNFLVRSFLCGVGMFSLLLCGFSLGTPASSHSPKHANWALGWMITLVRLQQTWVPGKPELQITIQVIHQCHSETQSFPSHRFICLPIEFKFHKITIYIYYWGRHSGAMVCIVALKQEGPIYARSLYVLPVSACVGC